MKRVKSAPANLALLKNNKKCLTNFFDRKCVFPVNNSNYKEFENENDKLAVPNKITVLNKKKKSSILTGIITDTYFEFSKSLPYIDNYYFNALIDIINNFVSNKFNKQNLENLLLSIFIRFFFSTIFHDLLIKSNDIIHYIKSN